ncbi:hypothetical protein FJV80_24720 [Mesorhizobium sp. WSM4310]|nr:hypothetical protein FJV80_24720 [Mesorhizobium sp. WSM4310]
MGLAVRKETRVFTLHVRCTNCLRESVLPIEIPDEEGAPANADDLVESGCLDRIRFQCGPCESVIAQLIGISGGELT